MGIFDYVSDLYAAMTVQEAYAEEPQKDEGEDGHKQCSRNGYQTYHKLLKSRCGNAGANCAIC